MSTVKKECRVIMLDTKEKSKFGFLTQKGKEVFNDLCWYGGNELPNILDSVNQHLYILSNDKISKGDWCILLDSFGKVFSTPQQYIDLSRQHLNDGLRKIIATTDNLNIHPNVSDSYRSGNCVPRIKDSFIERFIESYNKEECIESVMINFEQYDFRPDNSMGYFESGAFTYKLKAETNDIDNTISIQI